MNIVVTAGNTLVPIDQVRGITNIFTGRTGARIATCAHRRGHGIVLITSHPEVINEMADSPAPTARGWHVQHYRTFDDLHRLLEGTLTRDPPDALIHCAAVSDYQSAGIFAPAEGTRFDPVQQTWSSRPGETPHLLDRAAGKVKSDEPELWLRLVRTPKLVDRVRRDWNFGGILVKFKLEVGISEDRLLEIAERSRQQSHADLMVANTLEGAASWASLGPVAGQYRRVDRNELPVRLLECVETIHRERSHA